MGILEGSSPNFSCWLSLSDGILEGACVCVHIHSRLCLKCPQPTSISRKRFGYRRRRKCPDFSKVLPALPRGTEVRAVSIRGSFQAPWAVGRRLPHPGGLHVSQPLSLPAQGPRSRGGHLWKAGEGILCPEKTDNFSLMTSSGGTVRSRLCWPDACCVPVQKAGGGRKDAGTEGRMAGQPQPCTSPGSPAMLGVLRSNRALHHPPGLGGDPGHIAAEGSLERSPREGLSSPSQPYPVPQTTLENTPKGTWHLAPLRWT